MLNQHDDQVGGIIYFKINYCSIIISLFMVSLSHLFWRWILKDRFGHSFEANLFKPSSQYFYSFNSSKRSNNYYYYYYSRPLQPIILRVAISSSFPFIPNYKCSIYLLLFPFLRNSYHHRQDNNKQTKSLSTPNDRCEYICISNPNQNCINKTFVTLFLLLNRIHINQVNRLSSISTGECLSIRKLKKKK